MNKRSGAESRKRILAAAMDIFINHGYKDVNIREIAKKAGTSVGSIYLYFRNKEELYKSIIDEKKQEMIALTGTVLDEAKSATQAMRDFLTSYLDFAIKHQQFILLHIREHGLTFGINEKKQFFLTQRKLIERIIVKGIQSGEFRDCNARETARLILGYLRGVVISMALDNDGAVSPHRATQFVFQGLLSASDNTRAK